MTEADDLDDVDEVRSDAVSLDGGDRVLDVRGSAELLAGVLPGSRVIPLEDLEAHRDELVAWRPTVVVCAVGERSRTGVRWLRALGIEARSLRGGVVRWAHEGRPLEPHHARVGAAPRFARHLVLPEVGVLGQAKLATSRVLIVGVGGLGSPVALYLAAAGVGTLGLVDPDCVEESNLQRQIAHTAQRIGTPKVESARLAIHALHPDTCVIAVAARLGPENAASLVRGWDIVVDCLDRLAPRYALNAACVQAGLPLVHGAVHRYEGQVATFWPGRGACYACLHAEREAGPLTTACDTAGVLSTVPGVIGTLQATEVLTWLLGLGDGLRGRLLTLDVRSMRSHILSVARRPGCSVCGEGVRR